MRWSDLPRNPSPRTLRQFAVLWLVFFEWLAMRAGQTGHPRVELLLLVLGVTVGPVGLIAPRVVRPVFVGWMMLAFPIGWALSHVMMAIAFYGLFTPIGLVFRLMGR